MIVYITYLGHAGFCVETDKAIVIMDPWLSPSGAFDAAWFQFPRNHHLGAYVQEKLNNSSKEKYIYISHEHKDHFDPAFLHSLMSRDFTLIVPKFRRTELVRALRGYSCKGVIACEDEQVVPIAGGAVTLYLDDSEMDRDSAVLVQGDGVSFLNINDCKIHDRLQHVVDTKGKIDIFTAQFSGAVWHPTCYDYPEKVYQAISRKKMLSKFEAVARAIQTLQPRVYLTSAGPACFLDPELMHLNFEPVNIFPRAHKFLGYLKKRLTTVSTMCAEPMPGDTLDANTGNFTYLAEVRVTEENVTQYIRDYAALYEVFVAERKAQYAQLNHKEVLYSLREALQAKLEHLHLCERVKIPLYFRLKDLPGKMLKVDFPKKTVRVVTAMRETTRYVITAPSWEVARVLDGKLTWEDFTLTFRMRLNRDPDVYHVVIHGFLMMEAEDMNWFCNKVLDAENNKARGLVDVNGRRCSINRYCPHQGADLTQGWIENGKYLVCPRHRWHFDLEDGGKCTANDTTIRSFFIEDD